MEGQMPLGNVGFDALGCSLTWRWESGWRLRVWGRRSGSSEWLEAFADGEQLITADVEAELRAVLEHRGRPIQKDEPF